MDQTALLIITIVICALSLIISFISVILLVKNRKGSALPDSSLEKQRIQDKEEIKATINALNTSLNSKIDASAKANNEVLFSKVQMQTSDIAKENRLLFSELENSLNEKISIRLNEIQEKNNAAAMDLQKAVSDLTEKEAARLNGFEKNISDRIDSRFHDADLQTKNTSVLLQQNFSDFKDSSLKQLNSFQSSLNSSLLSSITEINRKIDGNMADINAKVNQSLQEGFKNTSESMMNLNRQLTIVEEAQKNIDDLQTQISSLTDILSNNQKRGKYGEYQLEMLIKEMFGETKGKLYDFQYTLSKGGNEEASLKPDAVIFLDGERHQQILPIDSKFSLTGYESLFDSSKVLSEEEKKKAVTSFKTALKKEIDKTSEYIIPGRTIGNALMFIPSDGIFAYIENDLSDVVEYGRAKRVYLVCPTILQPLLASFRMVQINSERAENLEKINQALNDLSKEFRRFQERWDKVNVNISRTYENSVQFNTTVSKLTRCFNNIAANQITGSQEKEEPASSSSESKD